MAAEPQRNLATRRQRIDADVGETVKIYDEHFWRNGHAPTIIVCDDSSPVAQEKYYPLLEQTSKGNFEVHLEHQRLEPSVNRLVFGMLTSALFLGSTLLWSYQAPPLIAGIPVLGVTGSLISFGLGLRLLWAIRKSGHLEKH